MVKSVTKSIFAAAIAVAVTSCQAKLVDKVVLIPSVDNVEILAGALELSELKTISAPEHWGYIADNFAEDIEASTGLLLSAVADGAVVNIVENSSKEGEAYTLDVNSSTIRIEAGSVQGANRALATLHQLIMTNDSLKAIPALKIEDSPRFEYRGLMIDCSRHFWSVDELKESVRQMALFKLNALHLHLTDNQGWRLAMEGYPELTEKGTYYYDFPEMSGKYYTKEDLKEIVRYAQERGIEIIPEVDMPGHNTALLAAMPQLSCRGGVFETYPEERPMEHRRRGSENMICIGNPQSIAFVEDVVDALVEIFPSKYIHLGGDEVPTNIWATCPKCMALYKKEGMKDLGEIQDHFTKQVSELIRSRGKVMIGWDEINDRHVATPEDLVMVWRNEGKPFQKNALERGVPVIMCPQHGCYFDWGYAGNSTRKVYEWDPIGEDITDEEALLVKGVQACLWTERVATQERLEWMLYPRLAALSEVMWSQKEQRNWDSFYSRITSYYPILERMGINFYDDDALNMAEFVATEEKPALVRNAQIETNMSVNYPYHAEYAFDGMTNSFFWGGMTIGPEHFFTLTLGEAKAVKQIKVITGDSKDYITKADLMVSSDGVTFKTVAQFDDLGEAVADLGGEVIKAVKIQVTEQHTCWPVIKEIILGE